MRENRNDIMLVTCIAVFLICIGVIASLVQDKFVTEKKAQDKFESLLTDVEIDSETETEEASPVDVYMTLGIENPNKVLDWEYLWEQNPDIYAWIYIPETKIDYPILQSAYDDSYYLEYNLDGTKGRPGCIYTEKINAKDFSDYNTLIYGHNMRNGTMFHDLHEFSDKEFFDEQKYVFIYMPDQVLIYEIYAAYEFTDAHILYTYDCFTEDGFASYLEVAESYAVNGNQRAEIQVTPEDTILTLSTCTNSDSEKRYLVQAVRIAETNEN